MRILILSDLYPPYHKGGHELRCKINAEEFRKRGHDILVLTSNVGGKNKIKEEGVYRKLHYRQSNTRDMKKSLTKKLGKLKQFFKNFSNYFITQNIIKKIRPDIVYVGQLTGVSLFPVRAIEKHGIPMVHHIGNYYLVDIIKSINEKTNFFKRSFHSYFQGLSDINSIDFKNFIAVSQSLKKQHVDLGLSESNITVIPPRGIPPEVFLDIDDSISEEGFLFKILFVGRIVKEKGVETLIRALDYLVNVKEVPSIQLDIIGGCDALYLDELKLLVDQCGLSGSILFKGNLSHEQVLKEYPKYHLLAVPSTWEEPFGMVVLEGMASGVPVVASRVGGIVDIIEDGKDGFLVPPGDSIALGEVIMDLFHDPSILQRVRAAATIKVKSEYSNDVIVEKLLERIEQARSCSIGIRCG